MLSILFHRVIALLFFLNIKISNSPRFTLEPLFLSTIKRPILFQIADEMKSRGGEPHPVQVDHSHDKEVEELFAKIGREQNGKLDILVSRFYLIFSYKFVRSYFVFLCRGRNGKLINGVNL